MSPHRRILAVSLICALSLVSACSGTRRSSARRVPPPPVATAKAETQPQSDQGDSRVDPAYEVLLRAEALESRGAELLRAGFVERAREQFQAALSLLRKYSQQAPDNFRIEREIDFLQVRIKTMETNPRDERAAIDDLAGIETSTENLDPGLRDRVRTDIEESTYDFPVEINDRVLSMLDYYTTGRGRSTIEVGMERIGLYRSMIEQIFAEEGVPLDLIYLAQAESVFKPKAVSSAKAKGMWQFISSRGREYGLRQNWWIDERSDPQKSTRAAARHLKDLYDQFGDWHLAMAAYNSGPARVSRAMKQAGASDFWTLADQRRLPRETKNYVPTIIAMTIIGKRPDRYGFAMTPAASIDVERVKVDKATDLRVIADYLDLPLETIQELNPHVLRWATPPDDSEFELNLPPGYRKPYLAKVAGLPEEKRILFRHHIVSSGETLSHIALRYDVSVRAITDANEISERKIIRIGESLVIPISGLPVPANAFARVSPPFRVARKAPTLYRIRRGDTLSEIAERYGLSVTDIRAWNDMSSHMLIAGRDLRLAPLPADQVGPGPGSAEGTRKVVYLVRPGDTLSEIASSYNTSVAEIREWNRESDLSIIRPGDQITIYRKP